MRSLLLIAVLVLTGCSENYRYPCQDPDNWSKRICQKPYCSANGTCPEDLTHYLKEKAGQTPNNPPAPQAPQTGECK